MMRFRIVILICVSIILSSSLIAQEKKDSIQCEERVDSCLNLLNQFKKDYILINRPSIGNHGSIDIGMFDDKDGETKYATSWEIKLKRKKSNSNVFTDVTLQYDSGKVANASDMLKKINSYYKLFQSVSWLSEKIQRDTTIKIELHFTKGLSFSYKAQTSFLSDLSLFNDGDERMMEELLPQLTQSVFLEITERDGKYSRWIILPSKEMILWHYKGDKVFDFNLETIKYRNYYGHKSVFLRVTPEGKIITPN